MAAHHFATWLSFLMGLGFFAGQASAQQDAPPKPPSPRIEENSPEKIIPRIDRDAIPLGDAIKQELVTVRITGNLGSCGDVLVVHIRRKSPKPLHIMVIPGTVFKSQSPVTQDMVSLGVTMDRDTGDLASQITLLDDKEHLFILEAYGIQFEKKTPTHREEFRPAHISGITNRFLQAARQELASSVEIQIAFWLELKPTDPATIRELYRTVTEADVKAAQDFLAKRRAAHPPATRPATGAPMPPKPMTPPPMPATSPPVASNPPMPPRGTTLAERTPDYDKFLSVARSLLGRYDTNKNGKLKRSEWGRMSAVFEQDDANHDGILTAEEMTAALLLPRK